MPRSKERVLVSGSHGFIGDELMNRLQAEAIPRKYLYGCHLDDLVSGAQTVIHCAAYGNMGWQEGLDEMFDANVMSTFNLLESCRRGGVKNFIFLGSSSEYGDKSEPMKEEMLPETRTMYGCTKVCGTYLTRHYSNYFNTVTVRPFSIYGEKEDPRRFIPTLIDALNSQKTFTLRDGKHDWLHLGDFCTALEFILKNMELLNGLVINIGSGNETSNEDILDTLCAISGKETELKSAPKKDQDSLTWVADIRKLKSLGWKQRISLYEGLKRVYDYRTANHLSQ